MLVAGKFAWVPHVKLPVKYLWYSGKFTCARRQCACVLREVLAASKQVNLPVITGKLHVTQVKRARDLFTCELHVKLPAFAGNFARASFTVYHSSGEFYYHHSSFLLRLKEQGRSYENILGIYASVYLPMLFSPQSSDKFEKFISTSYQSYQQCIITTVILWWLCENEMFVLSFLSKDTCINIDAKPSGLENRY